MSFIDDAKNTIGGFIDSMWANTIIKGALILMAILYLIQLVYRLVTVII